MTIIMIDGREMTDRSTAHTYLKKALSLPEYYGRNLDALYDCLLEMKKSQIIVTHVAEMKQQLLRYGDGILDTLEDGARKNPNISLILEEIIEEDPENESDL